MNKEKLKYIAKLVREGYTSGINPTWEIDIDEEDGEDEEIKRHEIAMLIKLGHTSGCEPYWKLFIKE